VKLAGADLTGAWTFGSTGGYQTWTTISKTVDLPPGQQVLHLDVLGSSFNLNWIELTPAAAGLVPDGTHKLINRNSGKAMDVVDASTANGVKVQQWSYAGNINQKWALVHKGANQYYIKSVQTGKAVDEASSTALSGDYISMWPVKTTAGQRWLLMPTDSGYYKIVSANSGLVLEIAGASTASGALVDQAEDDGGAGQQWQPSTP